MSYWKRKEGKINCTFKYNLIRWYLKAIKKYDFNYLSLLQRIWRNGKKNVKYLLLGDQESNWEENDQANGDDWRALIFEWTVKNEYYSKIQEII